MGRRRPREQAPVARGLCGLRAEATGRSDTAQRLVSGLPMPPNAVNLT